MSIIRDIKYFLKGVASVHRQGNKKNIIINATPRGGSTWLMEIIASQPGMKYYDEPFNVRRDNVKRTGLFSGWEDLQPENNNKEKIVTYINALTDNRYPMMNPPPLRKNYRPVTNRIVFKLHELEHMIEELAEQCNCQVIYLVRHPIPNSMSRAVVPRLELFAESTFYKEKYLSGQQDKEIQSLLKNGSELQRHIASWCYENLVALKHTDLSKWLVVSYEELVINSRKCCQMLMKDLELTDFDALLRSIDEPAVNIGMSNQDTLDVMVNDKAMERKKGLVTRWKKKISDVEEDKVFEVLSIFEIDDYKKGDYLPSDRLLNFDNTRELLNKLLPQ